MVFILIFFSVIVTGICCNCYTSVFCCSSTKQGTPVYFSGTDFVNMYTKRSKNIVMRFMDFEFN